MSMPSPLPTPGHNRAAHQRSSSHGFAALRDGLTLALLLAAGLLAVELHAQENEPQAAVLELQIENISSTEGPLMIQVLASEAAFAGDQAASASFVVPATQGTVSITVQPFVAGEYAVRVMQDLDNDGELKSGMLGRPKEPWGISNNASGRFGPPSWADARFTLPAATPQTIKLRQ